LRSRLVNAPGSDLAFPSNLSHLADYAYRSFPLRDVQPNVLLHHSCSESFDCESSTIARVPPSRTSTAITSSFAVKVDPKIRRQPEHRNAPALQSPPTATARRRLPAKASRRWASMPSAALHRIAPSRKPRSRQQIELATATAREPEQRLAQSAPACFAGIVSTDFTAS